MYAAVSWIPRGICKTKLPEPVPSSVEGADYAVGSTVVPTPDGMNSRVVDDSSEAEDMAVDEEGDASAEEDEAEGVDVAEVLANDLDSLAVFKSNADDPYMAGDPEAAKYFDTDELDDLVIRPTDAVVIAAKSGEDASMLEFHLVEEQREESEEDPTTKHGYKLHHFLHHDLVLPSLPLCCAFTSLLNESSQANLVAVGCFTPGIDVWDVERINVLEPLVTLGGYNVDTYGAAEHADGTAARVTSSCGPAKVQTRKAKKARKKRAKPRLRDGSHSDAVMCLSWNHVQREYLASGSADTTVKVWDVESGHCATTLRHHADKVQAVSWHESEESVLLSGSFDKTVQVVDVRTAVHTQRKWAVGTDVESCFWGHGALSERIVVTTEDGYVTVFDARKEGDRVVSWQAHEGPTTSCALSRDVRGMMLTGGIDKMVKVWDVEACSRGGNPDLVYERPSRAGAIFSVGLCPVSNLKGTGLESPFVAAFAGAKGTLVVSDLAVESDAVLERYERQIPREVGQMLKARATRRKRAVVEVSNGMVLNEDIEDLDDEEDEEDEWQLASGGSSQGDSEG